MTPGLAAPTYCKQCGIRITWAITVNDKRMPVDFDTSSKGNMVFEDGHVVVLAKDDPRLTDEDVPKWISHWATCSNPPDRKKKTT